MLGGPDPGPSGVGPMALSVLNVGTAGMGMPGAELTTLGFGLRVKFGIEAAGMRGECALFVEAVWYVGTVGSGIGGAEDEAPKLGMAGAGIAGAVFATPICGTVGTGIPDPRLVLLPKLGTDGAGIGGALAAAGISPNVGMLGDGIFGGGTGTPSKDGIEGVGIAGGAGPPRTGIVGSGIPLEVLFAPAPKDGTDGEGIAGLLIAFPFP